LHPEDDIALLQQPSKVQRVPPTVRAAHSIAEQPQ
jgi:hypothetical protein